MATVRDYIQHPITIEYFQERLSSGWKVRAIEWQKDEANAEQEQAASIPAAAGLEEPPYGFEVASDSAHLKHKPDEIQILIRILEMIVAEKKVAMIADELNRQGFRTRHGQHWTSSTVFDLLPRIVEVGPQLLKSDDWRIRRGQVQLPEY